MKFNFTNISMPKALVSFLKLSLGLLFAGSFGNYGYDCFKEARCPQIKTFETLYTYLESNLLEPIPAFTALTITFAVTTLFFAYKILFKYIPEILELQKNIDRVGLYETLVPVDQGNLMADRKVLWDLYFEEEGVVKNFIDILGITGEMTFSKQASETTPQKVEAAPLRQTLDKINKTLHVRVLLLSPKSQHFVKRVNDLYPCLANEKVKDYKKRLLIETEVFFKQTEAAIAYLKQKRVDGFKVSWQFYDRPPVWKLIITKNFVWQQIYPQGVHVEYAQTNIFSSTAEGASESGLYSGFKTIFDLLWGQFSETLNVDIPPLPYGTTVEINCKNKRVKFAVIESE